MKLLRLEPRSPKYDGGAQGDRFNRPVALVGGYILVVAASAPFGFASWELHQISDTPYGSSPGMALVQLAWVLGVGAWAVGVIGLWVSQHGRARLMALLLAAAVLAIAAPGVWFLLSDACARPRGYC